MRNSRKRVRGYSIDQSVLKGNDLSMEDAVRKLMDEESWRQILSSLVVCFFARGDLNEDDIKNAVKRYFELLYSEES